MIARNDVDISKRVDMKRFASEMIAAAAALFLARICEASPYAQLSSSQNQLGSSAPRIAKLNHTDAIKGISNSNGLITFKEAGAYFVMAAAQVGSAAGKGQGNVRLWMHKNGRDVANSNSEQTIVPGFTAVLVSQGILEVESGDTAEVVYSVTTADRDLGLIASMPSGEPTVPSLIFTTFKVDGSAFAQVSSSVTQASAAVGRPITLNNVDAARNLDNKDGVLTFQTAGTYLVMAAGQVGCTASSGNGRVRLWIRQNGQDINNSNCEQAIIPGFTAVLVSQGVMACKAGDTVEFIHSESGSGLGIVGSMPEGESAVPSMIVSIIKVADGAYAQLSSVESQAGASYPQPVKLTQTDAARNVDNVTGAMSTSISKGTVGISQDGVYFAIAAGQVGNTRGKGAGSLRLWLRNGGIDVAKSNTEQTVMNNFTAVLVSQGVGEAKRGDKLQLFHSARGAGVGLIATAPKGEPAVPSMIFTLVKVD